MATDAMHELESRSQVSPNDSADFNKRQLEDDIDSERGSSENKRLLKDCDAVSEEIPLHWQQRKGSRSTRRFGMILLGLTFLAIAGLSLLLLLRVNRKPERDPVKTNDYILDPHWDVSSPPQRREFFWIIKDAFYNPDGIYRPMILVNNQFPGPLVEVNEGDTIVVHVENQAVNATAIHWHGIYQKGTPQMDGTVGVTQCPISPGGKFTYEFTVSGQSGTYWWHAHHGVQSSDGLHGPLIIHSRDERRAQQVRYVTDRVIVVSDHYHDLSSALLWQYMKPDMENAEPVPNGAVINGRATRDCDEFADRKCDNSSSHVGLAAVDLQPDQHHRIRFVNTGGFAEFQVQFDEHELTVIEVDGTDVLPMTYHRINISPAQRYSVIINTNVANADSFWLRARMITQCFTDPPPNMQSEVRAILRYHRGHASSYEIPKSKDWDEMLLDECTDMNSTELVPVEVLPPPPQPDALFYLRSNFEIGAYRLSRGFFNSSSWRPDIRSPTLLRVLEGIKRSDSAFLTPAKGNQNGVAFVNDAAFDTSRELVVQTAGIQTIDILVSNFDDGDHPLHLHGYKYWVLAQGQGYPPLTHVGADINLENLAPLYETLDLSNPLRRDTASVEAYGWILLRFVTDNPGLWAFHCHLSWHSEAGLLMQFLTRSDDLARMEIPDANVRLCSAHGLEKGAGPRDEDYYDLAK
jgi:FtsP/CotA-like multicopper oxidase with cupredoxin domain